MMPTIGKQQIIGALLLFALFDLLAESSKRQPVPDPALTSAATHAAITAAMQRYCAAMHPGTTCTTTRMTGRPRFILSMHYAHASAPSRSAVDAVLTAQGWQGPVRTANGNPVYCKEGIGAIYSVEESWVFLSFSAGEAECAVSGAPASAH